MSRAPLIYAELADTLGRLTGQDISRPVEGFYRHRLSAGAVYGGVRVWYGAPLDPVTGEELDRSWRWQTAFNDEPIDFDRVWPACVGEPITEQDYLAYCARTTWAREHAPDSAYARTGRKLDLLSTQTPLPF